MNALRSVGHRQRVAFVVAIGTGTTYNVALIGNFLRGNCYEIELEYDVRFCLLEHSVMRVLVLRNNY